MAIRILFATGNPHKLNEASAILPGSVSQLDVDLPEIQSLDLQAIVSTKLAAAYEACHQPVIVEDVSAELEALNGFPGPFVKFAEKTMGPGALHQMLLGHKNKRARIIAMIGYHDGKRSHYFTGTYDATVVPPRGNGGFGFDQVVIPDGYDQTMAEMPAAQKNALSHRYKALKALADFLDG